MNTANSWERADKILCVRLDSLGDVLMTAPAIRAFKETRPGRRVVLMTSPAGAEAAALIPEVDEVLTYQAPWMKATPHRDGSGPEFGTIERLREFRFDAAVIFTVYSQNPLPSAVLCYLAEIPLRLAHCRENPYQLLTDWVPDPEPDRLIRHEVRRQLDLVAAVGASVADERMSIRIPHASQGRVAARLRQLGLSGGDPWILIHPGASAPSRRYLPEGFAEAARRLVLEYKHTVLFSGTEPERELVEEIRAAMKAPSFSLVGDVSLSELAALIGRASVLISNNTGPVHIAAAVGTPVVDLYALTNPQHTPWAIPHRVLSHDVSCKFCYRSICPEGHHNCLRLVPPSAVVEAARALLGNRADVNAPANPRLQEEEPAWIPWESTPLITIRPPASYGMDA
jgi:lipopolysaccharide heptosyltransferase II